VNKVGFTVKEGMIKSLIGPNGAGKTTLFNLISGVLRPDSGVVSFEGKKITGMKPFQIAAKGVTRTFQQIRLFPRMSVLENVMIGRHIHGRTGFLAGMFSLPWTHREKTEMEKRSLEIMDLLGIADLSALDAASLAYGQQRLVEIARALACSPKLLLLDEPAAGLNMRETEDMAGLITRIRDLGVTILLVEHDMGLVMNISDEIVVLSYGQKIADDTPLGVQKDREVIRVYLGDADA
jgi:branched-chain amino acid transport system ATP-binding protein